MVIAMINKKINNRYQILKTIGSGGMASVYKAYDVILNRHVAVKVLRPQFSDDEEFIRRFRREAQAATSLSHPNVVSIYDVGEEADLYYIVMEYVEGPTLKQLIGQKGTLSLTETVDIMEQITSAISHAHENHIVHRDIKPHNILISKQGEAKVTDFGIARAMTAATITHTNTVMGSVHYLSPEQARGGNVNEKSDIYSLGIVLYEMVTGKVPFSGDTAVSIAIKHLQMDVPSPRENNPTLPQSIENIILKATAKDPLHRYNDVSDMEADLNTALNPSRFNEEKFVTPKDSEEETRALPIIKEGLFNGKDIENTIIKETDPNSGDDNLKKDKKRKKWPVIMIVALILIFSSVLAAFSIIPKLFHVDEVTIPGDMIGMEYEEVFQLLTDLDLIVDKEMRPDDEIEAGLVISHNPVGGRIVKVNTPITVLVSEGKEKLEMDDYTTQNKDLARRNLINLGFKAENIIENEEATDDHPENTVISQIPQSGVMVVPEETTVIITYSVAPLIRLDNLQGYNREDVIEYLQDNELSSDFGDRYSDGIEEGKVIEQNPSRNMYVSKGDVIKVIFSLGPEPKPEPEPEPEPELKPVSTFVEVEVPVSEEDQLANQIYVVTITYNDSTTLDHVRYLDEKEISETTNFKVPVTINPTDTAEVKVLINGEDYSTHLKTYQQAVDNE
jgi:serine/threonine protein kinase